MVAGEGRAQGTQVTAQGHAQGPKWISLESAGETVFRDSFRARLLACLAWFARGWWRLSNPGCFGRKCLGRFIVLRKGLVFVPEFGTALSGLASGRKLTPDELVRAVRFMVAAEYEAVQLYVQLAESTDNKLAQDVLRDIADEERVHAGEFLRLLKELAPDEETFYEKGAHEVEKIIAGQDRR